MSKLKNISKFNFRSKKVLIRVDLNVPLKKNIISDPTRIKAIVPTLKEISKKGGMSIIISHFGRPEGRRIEKYSLKIIRISRKELIPKDGVEDWVLDLNKKSSWIRIVKK